MLTCITCIGILSACITCICLCLFNLNYFYLYLVILYLLAYLQLNNLNSHEGFSFRSEKSKFQLKIYEKQIFNTLLLNIVWKNWTIYDLCFSRQLSAEPILDLYWVRLSHRIYWVLRKYIYFHLQWLKTAVGLGLEGVSKQNAHIKNISIIVQFSLYIL